MLLECSGQTVQFDSMVDAVVLLYRPAGHTLQLSPS
eukprot:COSAG05_NODE_11624_length_504_cov_1.849383_1_plen_35_part_10